MSCESSLEFKSKVVGGGWVWSPQLRNVHELWALGRPRCLSVWAGSLKERRFGFCLRLLSHSVDQMRLGQRQERKEPFWIFPEELYFLLFHSCGFMFCCSSARIIGFLSFIEFQYARPKQAPINKADVLPEPGFCPVSMAWLVWMDGWGGCVTERRKVGWVGGCYVLWCGRQAV